ncbi:hypothetical protein ECC02_000460 [Trypanosoma cruzi]|uniref:Uncharacterized protein n=1 Tax=Trypanosoma cruzi TaxID=5693 RepID=A0A7J6YIU5_TRYCR|nr:hypothetical protein ECC02_000460 [Trypanosoma cruzi]
MDVDKSSLFFIFEDFQNSLEKCDFYAVDQEMTGVDFDGQQRSRFMSLPELYEACRGVVKRYIAFQFGITLFTRLKSGGYEVKPYNFYLLKEHCDFGVNTDAIKFLVAHKLDFQKWLAFGVHYCNKEEEGRFTMKKENPLCFELKEKIVFHVVNEIKKWYLDPYKKEEEILSLKTVMTKGIEALVISTLKEQDIYVNLEYDEISKLYELPVELTVHRVDRNKSDLEGGKTAVNSASVFSEKLGFRQIWKCLTKCKKPIIGHNFWLDIMFMLHMHEAPLPARYEDFKKQVHELFPCIYDTKTLSKTMFFSKLNKCYHLDDLYKECCKINKESKDSIVFQFPPGFHFYDEKCIGSEGKAHEAGYDAYMTGIVFAIMKDVLKNGDEIEFKKWENVISVYGNNYYMSVVGNDFLKSSSIFLIEFEEHVDARLVQSLISTEKDIERIKNNQEPASFLLDLDFCKSERHDRTFFAQFDDGNTNEKTIRAQIDLSKERISLCFSTTMKKREIIFPQVKNISRFTE